MKVWLRVLDAVGDLAYSVCGCVPGEEEVRNVMTVSDASSVFPT
jgi:hypothetical protein